MVIDPICSLTVDKSTERRAYFNEETVYFCSEQCREKFVSAPDAEKHRFCNQVTGMHTCDKHPELWQENPCDCPKCRMALGSAAMSPDTGARERSNLHEGGVRFRIAAALVSPLMRGWRALTAMHLNRFINPPGQSTLKFRKRFRTTTPSSL